MRRGLVVTMSTTLATRLVLGKVPYHAACPSGQLPALPVNCYRTGKAPRQEIGASGASTGAKARIRT